MAKTSSIRAGGVPRSRELIERWRGRSPAHNRMMVVIDLVVTSREDADETGTVVLRHWRYQRALPADRTGKACHSSLSAASLSLLYWGRLMSSAFKPLRPSG